MTARLEHVPGDAPEPRRHEAREREGGHEGRAGAEEPGDAELGPDEGQGRYQSDGHRARAQAAAEGGTVTLDLRRPKAPGQERRCRARERPDRKSTRLNSR